MFETPEGGPATSPKGAHTLPEILSQPECRARSLRDLEQSGTLEALAGQFAGTREWLFVGCGSSYYVAQSAAATMTELAGVRARAVAASELLLFSELVLPATGNCAGSDLAIRTNLRSVARCRVLARTWYGKPRSELCSRAGARNLSRVVVLEKEDSPEESKHAAI